MADFSAYRVALLASDYPTKYDGFITVVQGYCTEVENGRQGQASLAANFARYVPYSGLTANLPAGGFKITGLGAPTAVDDAVTKAYADGLSFASALPAQAGNDDLVIRTSGGTASWGNWWGTEIALTGAGTLTNRKAYHADSSGGAFSVNLPPAVPKGWILIRDVALACAQEPITLVPDGTDEIYGAVQNYVMDVSGETLLLVVDPVKGWVRA